MGRALVEVKPREIFPGVRGNSIITDRLIQRKGRVSAHQTQGSFVRKLMLNDVMMEQIVESGVRVVPENCELKSVIISPPHTLKASSGSESGSPKRRGQRQLKKQ